MNAGDKINAASDAGAAQSQSQHHFSGRDPVNNLRILADFEHQPRHGAGSCDDIGGVYDELSVTSTALEFVMVMLHELEDKQIRSDYLRCLLAPHIEHLFRTTQSLSNML